MPNTSQALASQSDDAVQAVIAALIKRVDLPSAEELYDVLMEAIEPELKRDNMAHVEKPLAGETQEQMQGRLARYDQAFGRYEHALSLFTAAWAAARRGEQRNVMNSIEDAERVEEHGAIASIEASLTSILPNAA